MKPLLAFSALFAVLVSFNVYAKPKTSKAQRVGCNATVQLAAIQKILDEQKTINKVSGTADLTTLDRLGKGHVQWSDQLARAKSEVKAETGKDFDASTCSKSGSFDQFDPKSTPIKDHSKACTTARQLAGMAWVQDFAKRAAEVSGVENERNKRETAIAFMALYNELKADNAKLVAKGKPAVTDYLACGIGPDYEAKLHAAIADYCTKADCSK